MEERKTIKDKEKEITREEKRKRGKDAREEKRKERNR